MQRRPRKMVPIVKNVRQMYKPVESEKMTPAETVEVLIEEVESDIYKATGDEPLLEVLSSPHVQFLQKRLALLKKKQENINRAKKSRNRHGANKIRIEGVNE